MAAEGGTLQISIIEERPVYVLIHKEGNVSHVIVNHNFGHLNECHFIVPYEIDVYFC